VKVLLATVLQDDLSQPHFTASAHGSLALQDMPSSVFPPVPCSSISMCHKALSIWSRGASAAAEIRASDIGTRAGLFEVQKIGDEFFTFVVDCDKPKACSIVLRGASKVRATCTVQQVAAQLYAHHTSVCLLHHSSHLVSQGEDCPSQNSCF